MVGAGYTGTEVAAQGVLLTDNLRSRARRSCATSRCAGCSSTPRSGCCPSSTSACRAPRTGCCGSAASRSGWAQSVEEAGHDGVRLTTGENVATRSLIWCVGVRADPLVESLGLKTEKGRVVVDEFMRVPGHPEVFASGDAAAVPDVTRPGQSTAMTAQHAERQGKLVARNVAASLGHGTARRYKHHDLGFVVELGGRDAAANPLHVPLAGLPAKAVTRGYHLTAMPGNRIRTRPTGRWTRCCRARRCSWGWCGPSPCRWRPPRRSTRTALLIPRRPRTHVDVTWCHAQVTRWPFPPGKLRFMAIDGDPAVRRVSGT